MDEKFLTMPGDVADNVLLAIMPIFKALDEVLPGWNTPFNAPERNAAAAIRKLAEDAKCLATGTRPFDLAAAKRGEPIVTRDGRKVRFIAHVPEACEQARVVVMIEGSGVPAFVSEDGRYTGTETPFDLFMAPRPKRTLYVNAYTGPIIGRGSAEWFADKAEAQAEAKMAPAGCIAAAVAVEIEEP